MRPAIPQNKPHDYSWSIISNRHLKKGLSEKEVKNIIKKHKSQLKVVKDTNKRGEKIDMYSSRTKD